MSLVRAAAANLLARWTEEWNPPAVPERGAAEWRNFSPRDRGFAFDLITGVIRRKGTLDAVLRACRKESIDTLEPKVAAVLRLGAYQILLHAGTADYAAVDSSVEVAREIGAERATGLVNAVLRGITRLVPKSEPRKSLSPQTFPIDFATQMRFSTNIFPPPGVDAAKHLAAVTSHPRELIKGMIEWHGQSTVTNICIADNHRPMVILRSDDAAFKPPAHAGLVAHAERGYFVAAEGWNEAIEKLVGSGVLSPQDPTAGNAVRMAAEVLPNARRVADLCAGMGTKTMQMSRAWENVEVAASDIDALKLERLSERAAIMGETNVRTFAPKHLTGKFDVALADVPCSNTGVMARRVQSRWRWPKLDIDALLRIQREILQRAAELISPGGVVVYSTCSIDPRENQKLVDGFVQRHAGWKKVAEKAALPAFSDDATQAHDGGYVAILQRT